MRGMVELEVSSWNLSSVSLVESERDWEMEKVEKMRILKVASHCFVTTIDLRAIDTKGE